MPKFEKLNEFYAIIANALMQQEFIKLIISNKRSKGQELRSVTLRPVEIKGGSMLQFVHRYPTKDITKNFSFSEGEKLISELLENTFMQGELFTSTSNWHLFINKKHTVKLSKSAPTKSVIPKLNHDKQKNRLIDSESSYLQELGITDQLKRVKPSMQDKYKQINKYVEIIEGILKSFTPPETFHVTDMGSGKGYLTFALYEYLTQKLNIKSIITGVEFRKDLVDKCNSIANKVNFSNLNFTEGSIANTDLKSVDMLIALHACDTATDDAIYKGIKSKAKFIICAPCCHKQIRKQIKPENELNLISQYGILKERQAEILTDTIRSQILEAFGYKTKVFEFISTEHTPKNVMIVGIQKKSSDTPDSKILDRINEIKKLHGIKNHYLEKLLELA